MPTDQITIRTATPADRDVLVEMQCLLSAETEHQPLDTTSARLGIDHLLHTPAIGYYLIAEDPIHTIVGCLLVLSEWSTWQNAEMWWLHDVYVLPAWRQAGVFRRLYDHVRLEVMANPRVLGLRLYVNQDNASARRTYERLGMQDEHWALYEWLSTTDG
ncbi:MAG TPA: GNAT family N-acetyltransferase [Gemmatimonadaceae bacterium]|jgi:GNAT superfamily N-acetyltransferase|nr:GNAT family N-acetyltransferase [Gemmatimonadaceae bacterium]